MNKLVSLKNKLGNPAKSKKGFTLVEMIIVMVIMAILAAALIPTMMGYINDAKDNTNLATARAYYVAAQSIATEKSATEDTLGADAAAILASITGGTRWTELTSGLPNADDGVTAITVTDFKIDTLTYASGVKGEKILTINAGDDVTWGAKQK